MNKQNKREIGKKEGAKILMGGEPAEMSSEVGGGYYIQPTIFSGSKSMQVCQEEIFGPLLPVVEYDEIDEATK